jgi:hypothetical protein
MKEYLNSKGLATPGGHESTVPGDGSDGRLCEKVGSLVQNENAGALFADCSAPAPQRPSSYPEAAAAAILKV